MTAPFNDSELTQIDQPDDLNDSGFDGPWNQDFESTYPHFPVQFWFTKKQISHFGLGKTSRYFKIIWHFYQTTRYLGTYFEFNAFKYSIG